MPLPSERTFDPAAPAEGTKYDPDATYAFDSNLGIYAYWAVLDTDGSRRLIGYKHVNHHAQIPTDFPGSDAYLIHRDSSQEIKESRTWR